MDSEWGIVLKFDKQLFYGPEAAITHQYAYPNPVEEVAKENMPTHERVCLEINIL